MRRIATMFAAAGMLAAGAGAASAITIDFAGLGETVTPFTLDGFDFALNGGNNPHVNDGVSGFVGWHDGGDNAPNAVLTMTKNGGGTFTFNSFDVLSLSFPITGVNVTASDGTNIDLSGTGTKLLDLVDITSISFDWIGGTATGLDNRLDNFVIDEPTSPVPLPAAALLLATAFAGWGAQSRLRRG